MRAPSRPIDRQTQSADRHAARLRAAPDRLWCAYFDGQSKLGSGRYSHRLAVTGHAPCFLLLCEAPEAT